MAKQGFTPGYELSRKYLRIHNEFVREGISEILGTCILMIFTNGSSMQHFYHIRSGDSFQPLISATFGTILGIMIAVMVTGGSSGAHINPAVSLGFCMVGALSWIKLPLYWICQFIGAFLGTSIAYHLNKAKLKLLAGDFEIHETFPHPTFLAPYPNTSLGLGFADQVLSTAILLMAILAIIDKNNMKFHSSMMPITVALTVCGINLAYYSNGGSVLNPVRDFVPRLFAIICIGYDAKYAMQNVYNGEFQPWWLVGIFATTLGSVLGTVLYVLLIGAHLPDESERKKKAADSELHEEDSEKSIKIKRIKSEQNKPTNKSQWESNRNDPRYFNQNQNQNQNQSRYTRPNYGGN